jgi:predicted DNA-binding protein with PD1-like motif
MPAPRSSVRHPGPISEQRLQAVEGTVQAELRLEIEPGATLFDSLHEVFSERGVSHARIRITGGTFSSLSYHTAPPDPTGKHVIAYDVAQELLGGGQIVTAHGIYGIGPNGNPFLHLHGALLDCNGAVYGGHLPGNRLVTGAPVTVWAVALADAGFRVTDDTETDMSVFQPVPFNQNGDVR